MKTWWELLFLFISIFTTIILTYSNFPSDYGHIILKFYLFIVIFITQFLIHIIYDYKYKNKIVLERYLIDSIITGLSGIIGYSLYNDILLININIHYKLYSYMQSPFKTSAIQTLITMIFILLIKMIKLSYEGIQLITFKDSIKCNKKIENNMINNNE